jgi:apolipoprotein N-acyltransferase
MSVKAENHPVIKSVLVDILLVLSGSSFFALANPGFIFPRGISFFAWFMYVPLFMTVERSSYKSVWFWGGLYGVVSYLLYTSWLVSFNSIAMIAVSCEYFFLYAVLFLFLKTAGTFCGKSAWILQWLILCAYEYIKTVGFTGFSYGVSAYTQWRNIPLIQCSNLTGVWGLTAIIDFASVWIYRVISDAVICGRLKNIRRSIRSHAVSLCIWIFCLCSVSVYGFICINNKKDSGKFVKVCAVQNNTDPWKGGVASYERDCKNLMRLTDKALAAEPDIQLVVWPETAVVPSIIMQYNQRKDRTRFDIINSVLEYIDKRSAVFVIGNFHSVDNGGQFYDDYNCAFVFTPGKNVIPPEPEIYAKIHLVPFTESFPYGKMFPYIYKLLLHGDTHLWTAGTERKVFTAAGVSFSVPICFEDTFGNDCRKFVDNGAGAFINMSNDAWSESLSCQYQHLSMAVFRSAESRIPSVRSTASGQTCIVDRDGRVIAEAEPFTETYITGSIPVVERNRAETLYDKIGDLPGIAFVIISVVWLAAGIIWNKRAKRDRI